MPRYAVYFTRRYTMTVEADNAEQATTKALDEFIEDEANAASDWEAEDYIDKVED